MSKEKLIQELLLAIREIFQNPSLNELENTKLRFTNSSIEINLVSKFLNPVSTDSSYILALNFDSRELAINYLENEVKYPVYNDGSGIADKVNSVIQNIDSYFKDGKYIIPLFELKLNTHEDESSIDVQCINNFFSFHKAIIKLDNKL